MTEIPREPVPDSSLSLLRDGYEFISRRTRRHGSDVFRTRLLLQDTICMSGPEAARVFYDESRFRREGAAPRMLRRTLFGEGGVQGLDDDVHRRRKMMFMTLMSTERVAGLVALARQQWLNYMARWDGAGDIVLFDQAREIICRAVCAWAGVPLAEDEVARRTAQIGAMIEGSGSTGLDHIRARRARGRAERWTAGLIRDVRTGALAAAEGSALRLVALHREPDGTLLDARIAAVELLNVLRPTVAVARYITFAAHALHRHPEHADRIAGGDDEFVRLFVQEVRRWYPFFPFVAARVRTTFDWRGYTMPEGARALLDLYGTNHDPRAWSAPDEFRPERFREWSGDPYTLIPQGGGDFHSQHRCPGEWITIELMQDAVRLLTRSMIYDVPEQDLGIDLTRMPALPESGFVIRSVRPYIPRRLPFDQRTERLWRRRSSTGS